jgi:hypothetical protein
MDMGDVIGIGSTPKDALRVGLGDAPDMFNH